jgi:hypothetical protein
LQKGDWIVDHILDRHAVDVCRQLRFRRSRVERSASIQGERGIEGAGGNRSDRSRGVVLRKGCCRDSWRRQLFR